MTEVKKGIEIDRSKRREVDTTGMRQLVLTTGDVLHFKKLDPRSQTIISHPSDSRIPSMTGIEMLFGNVYQGDRFRISPRSSTEELREAFAMGKIDLAVIPAGGNINPESAAVIAELTAQIPEKGKFSPVKMYLVGNGAIEQAPDRIAGAK